MKKVLNKKSMLITSVALLLLVAVGTTLAYIFTKTEPVENKFNPSKVSCAVVEDDGDPVAAGTHNTGTEKKDVQIKNTGDTDAYIRVAVVVNWMNEDGTKVWATKPVAGEDKDYMISYNLSNGWIDGGDSYYYYTQPVDPGDMTDSLITSATQNVTGPKGTDGTQYYLSIEIVASAIQADGMGATSAQDAWAKAKTTTNAG